MNADNKICVVSTMNAQVGITLPDLRLNKSWPKKGTKIFIEKDVLEEAMYDPGVKYMFDEGILYIEDMKEKINLGLEPEGATEPQNIIVLSDMQMTRYLKISPISELEDVLKKISHEQRINMANFAIAQTIGDRDKCDLLYKYSGINVDKAIELNRSMAKDNETK